jgi:hypothetical protein
MRPLDQRDRPIPEEILLSAKLGTDGAPRGSLILTCRFGPFDAADRELVMCFSRRVGMPGCGFRFF